MFEFSGNGSGEEGINDTEEECVILLAQAHVAATVVHAIVLSIIITCSLAGNVLVLALVGINKQLRTRSTLVSLSMVLADLLFTLTYSVPTLITTIAREWLLGHRGCISFGFLASDFLITRWLIVCLLCLDRFCTVRFPFSYNRRGKYVMIILNSIAWVLPLIVSAIPIHVVAEFQLRQNQPTCLPTCIHTERSGLCRLYYAVVFTITFIIGSIVPITLYSWLYCKARRVNKSVKHTLGHHTIQIAGGVAVTQPVAEYQEINKEKKATVTFLLIFMAVVVTGTPAYLLQVFRIISERLHCMIPIVVHFLLIDFFLCASMLTPLVILRDSDFRACLARLFCCRKKTSDMYISNSNHDSDTQPNERTFFRKSSSFENQVRRSSISTTPTSHAMQRLHCDSDTTPTANNTNEPTVYAISES